MGERILIVTAAGLEAARGTAAAANRKIYGETELTRNQELRAREETSGKYARNVGASSLYPGLIEASASHTEDATYEDLAWWGQCALAPVASVDQLDGTYLWTFTPSQTADNLKSCTIFQRDEVAGTTFKMERGLVDEFELSGAVGQALKMRAALIGEDVVPVADIADPGDRERTTALSKFTKLYVGAAGADPSTLPLQSGTLIDWSVRVRNAFARKYFQGDGDVMSGEGRSYREIEADFTFEQNAFSLGERANWVGKTERTVKLETVDGNNRLTLVIPGLWETFAHGTRDTNRTVTMRLRALLNAAHGYDVRMEVRNAVETVS